MIFKNPYSFVSKHYKLINFLLLIPLLYITLKFGDIAKFFRDYVKDGYFTVETNFADNYVTGLTIITCLFLSLSNLIIFIILNTKKKKRLYHPIVAGYGLILFLLTIVFHTCMVAIQDATLRNTFANFIRDLANMSFLPGYFFLAYGVINTIGFNIKTFRIDNNSDLRISDDDEDDVEIQFNSEKHTLKRNLVHIAREMKYYVLENKLVISLIAIVLLGSIAFQTYQNIKSNNSSILLSSTISMKNISLTLKDSIISDVDYRGTTISKDKYYLAVKIGIQNTSNADIKLDDSSFRIYMGKTVIFPTYDKSSRFVDMGRPYQGEPIRAGKGDDYVFVYELTKSQIKNSYQMRILQDLTKKSEKLIKNYKKLTIKPKKLIKVENIGTAKIGEKIELAGTTLGKSSYTLESIEQSSYYQYTYDICKAKNDCQTVQNSVVASGNNILLIIKDKLELDETTPYYKNSKKDFYQDFVRLHYQKNTTEDNSLEGYITLKNVTPSAVENVKIYEVSAIALTAEKTDISLLIRNKRVTINLE